MSWSKKVRQFFSSDEVEKSPLSRRKFFTGLGGATVGAGILAQTSWAEVEERANRFGITPGTVVDAHGNPVEPSSSDPFLAQIIMFGGNFAPRGWALCEGQLLAINQAQALFSLLGTTYGGDGRTTFGLPDLRGRAPIQQGQGPGLSDYRLGQKGGAESTILTTAQIPSHNHPDGGNKVRVRGEGTQEVGPTTGAADGASGESTGNTGGSQPHTNIQPYLGLNFIIATVGTFPSRS